MALSITTGTARGIKTHPRALELQKKTNLDPSSQVEVTNCWAFHIMNQKPSWGKRSYRTAAMPRSQDSVPLLLAPIAVFLWFSCFPFCPLSRSPGVSIKIAFPCFSFPPLAFREAKQGQAGHKKLFSQQRQRYAIKLKRSGCAACASLPCFRAHLQRDSSLEWVT